MRQAALSVCVERALVDGEYMSDGTLSGYYMCFTNY